MTQQLSPFGKKKQQRERKKDGMSTNERVKDRIRSAEKSGERLRGF